MPCLSAPPSLRTVFLATVLAAPAARAADVATYLPDGTMLVVSFNVQQFLQAPLVRDGGGSTHAIIKDAIRAAEGFGIEPGKDLDRVLLAVGEQMRAGSMLMLFHGRFDPEKVQQRIKDRAKERKSDIEVLDESGAAVFQFRLPPPGPNPKIGLPNHFGLTVLDANTIALAVDRAALTEALAKKAGRRKADLKPRMVELVGKVDLKESLSVVFVPPAERFAGGPLSGLTTLTGGLTVADGIQTDLRMDTNDAVSARLLADNVRDGWAKVRDILPGLATLELGIDAKDQDAIKEMVDSFKVSIRPDGVVVSSSIAKDLIEKIHRKDR